MSKLYVTEYAGSIPEGGLSSVVPQEPALAIQVVDYSGGAAASAAFNPATRYVEIHTDAICSYRFGTAPVATTSNTRMIAGQTKLLSVNQNFSGTSQLKVSAVINT